MQRAPAWAAPYVGMPYKPGGRGRDGIDCWGLFMLVHREQFGRDLADYDGPIYAGRRDARAVAEAAEAFARRFREIDVADAASGDGLMFSMGGAVIHIGLVIAPGLMLHIEEKCESVVENYRAAAWRGRIAGAYRAEGAS